MDVEGQEWIETHTNNTWSCYCWDYTSVYSSIGSVMPTFFVQEVNKVEIFLMRGLDYVHG